MSVLFTPAKIGSLEIGNRFVNSATHECMADQKGMVTDELIKRYVAMARGEVGLIITGHMYVHPHGKLGKGQAGIHDDVTIPGLKKLVSAVHDAGGRIVFQLTHSGKSCDKRVIGRTPMAPSNKRREFLNPLPKPMDKDEIEGTIKAFATAAKRAEESGADGIQIHAAHGYLISEFLSPFYNRREDDFGGSDENRFRFLKLAIEAIKENVPGDFPVLVKYNSDDCTSETGATPELAAKYARWMVESGVAGIEVSCGFGGFSGMATTRGEVPVKEYTRLFPFMLKPMGWLVAKSMVGKFEFEEGYNRAAAKIIKPGMGDVPLILVGGLRRVEFMEDVIEKKEAEFISMCRPFIRQPNLVKQIREGRADSATCTSCNKCLVAVIHNLPIRCYQKELP